MGEHDDLFRELCENANDLIQSVDPRGGILYVNRVWLDTLGYSREEALRLNIFEVIHPDSREHCMSTFKEILEGRTQGRIEANFQTKDGKQIPVEGSVNCKFDGDKPLATTGIFRDMRERIRAQEELDRLFNLSQDMMCVAGTDGFFKQINPAFERVLGYRESELLSVSFLEYVHPEDRDATVGEVAHLAEGQPSVDFENRYLAKDGSYRWLAWRATPDPVQGLIYAVARDVTETKRVQALLKQQAADLARSNADLETFAYAASHDLRSPLRSITKLTNWIEQDLEGRVPAEVSEHIEKLRSRAQRMDTLIEELLAYSRAGEKEKQLEHVDAGKLVEELRELIGPAPGMEVIAEALPVLETARAPFAQVLRNLIDNALKHHDRDRGRVVVSATATGEFYQFSVADNGPGIPAEDRKRVFETFETGAADGHRGHGLGLSLVQRLVETYGGRIWIEAAKPRGTVFHFTWPRREVAAEDDDAHHSGS